MKKINTKTRVQNERHRRNQQRRRSRKAPGALANLGMKIPEWTVGLDLGDEESFYCILNQGGDAVLEGRTWTRRKEMERFFRNCRPAG